MQNIFRPSKSLSMTILGIGFAAVLIAVAAADTTGEPATALVRTRQGMVAGLTASKVE